MNRTLATGLGAYAAFGLVTLAIAHNVAGAPPDLGLPIVALLAGVGIPVALFVSLRAGAPMSRVFELLFVIIMLASLFMVWLGLIPERPYGDTHSMIDFIGRRLIYPRWLVGMAATVSLHGAIWPFPPISANLPAHVATPAPAGLGDGTAFDIAGKGWQVRRASLRPTSSPRDKRQTIRLREVDRETRAAIKVPRS